MELLELLEQRVVSLLDQVNTQREELDAMQASNSAQGEEITALRAVNTAKTEAIAALEADKASLQEELEINRTILEEENRTLKESLEHERAVKENVRGRIDMLLSQIKETADKA